MTKVRMNDIVILLPGITGSVLQKNGRDIWSPTVQSAWAYITSLGDSLQQLQIGEDDPEADSLGDGIEATALMPKATIVPGLVKIEGYTDLSRFITDNFEVIKGHSDDEKPANFFHFPYDWRRDNRASARRLQQLIKHKLPQWKEYTGNDDAKVILLAHSMGGLVCRYYVEVLEGWRDCKALFTFGTPHRGSVNALNYMVNGYKQFFVDLTEVLRSLSSAYQLLPIYEVVRHKGSYQRVAEVEGIPNVDRRRAAEGLEFHRKIEKAIEDHAADDDYRKFVTLPVVGTRQPTLQQAILGSSGLEVAWDLPSGIDSLLGDGDGTVPRVSAIPIELSEEYRETFLPQRHGALPISVQSLQLVRERLVHMQVSGSLRPIRGPEVSTAAEAQPAISVDVEDFYRHDEPVTIRAHLINTPRQQVLALVGDAAGDRLAMPHEFVETSDGWELTLPDLEPGLYRMEVQTSGSGPESPPSVLDLFEVAPQEAG
jgi:pimeloyl-ACP methyl ester carboxylesterase